MSRSTLPRTAFADAERSMYPSIEADNNMFRSQAPVPTLLEELPTPLLVLNAYRQLVFANAAALRFLGLETVKDVLGLRIGEILECPYATGNLGGCGTMIECRSCGVTNAVLAALEGRSVKAECRIKGPLGETNATRHFEEYTIPYHWKGKQFVIVLLGGLE